MKNLFLLLFAALMTVTTIDLAAENTLDNTESAYCTWKSWFKYPKNNGSLSAGKSVYVRVDAQKHYDIQYMELYLNGKFVRKESSYPYEWCKGNGSSDRYLRNLKPGTYNLKCKIRDKCNEWHEISCKFYVKGGGGHPDHPGDNNCYYKADFHYPQSGQTYKPGSNVYVKLNVQNYNKIAYTELYLNGKFIRKETTYPYEWCKGNGNSDGYLRNLKPGTYKLTCKIKDKCGKWNEIHTTFYVKGGYPGGGNNHCDYKVSFLYPKAKQSYNAGSNVYVKLNAHNYNKIEYTELYLNGKFIRKETTYPYEWCKGNGNSDGYLRNLKPGTYKLTCKVKDKCGKWYEFHCTFYVKGGNNGGGHDYCKYKSWFKYPKNNGSYRYGDDVYVRVDTERYQDVEYMELYLNGKKVRKENNYPYEWCKGNGNSDQYLRNLKRGTYNLKCIVKTKCGKYYDYKCKFYVR